VLSNCLSLVMSRFWFSPDLVRLLTMDEVRGVIGCPAQGKGWAGKNARDQLERLVILTARGVRGHSLNACPKSIPSRPSDEVTRMDVQWFYVVTTAWSHQREQLGDWLSDNFSLPSPEGVAIPKTSQTARVVRSALMGWETKPEK